MYCKHCGKEIADDSRFCQHCGGNITGPIRKNNYSILFLYTIWVVFNLCLLLPSTFYGASEWFYPFTKHEESYCYYSNFNENFYDGSEFVVYVILIPLAIFTGYKVFQKRK